MLFGNLILLAAAWSLSVDTGSPLHVMTDPVAVRPRIELRSTDGAVSPEAVSGTVQIVNYFGDRLALPLVATNGVGVAEFDLRRTVSSGGVKPRMKGVWTVTAHMPSTLPISAQFAVLDEHPLTPRLKPPKFRLGINYHVTWYGARDRALTLDALTACGCKLVRCGGFACNNTWIDEKSPAPDFTRADEIMTILKERGISVNASCWPFPDWALLRTDLPYQQRIRTPPKVGVARTYCQLLANHFGDDIDYLETSNEADLWATNLFAAVDYISYQRECYEGVKAGCESIRVLPSAFAVADSSEPMVRKKGFQETVLQGAKGFYDVHPVHLHYAFGGYVSALVNKFFPMRKRLGVIVPWYANETSLTGVHGNEKAVAVNVWQKIVFSWAHGSTDYIWYNLRATGDREDDPEQWYGLLSRDYHPRAGFAAFSSLAYLLTGADFERILCETRGRCIYLFRKDADLILVGWDVATEPAFPIRLKTDAIRARTVDLMGNEADGRAADGGAVFMISRLPSALVLERAQMADLREDDLATIPPPPGKSMNVLANVQNREPDFVLNSSESVRNLYAGNPETVARTWKGPSDLSARIWIGRKEESLHLRFAVRDDVESQRFSSAQMYLGDSIQFIVQSMHQNGNFEFGVARNDQGDPLVHVWIVPAGFDAQRVTRQVQLKTGRKRDITWYDVRIPLSAIGFDEQTLAGGFRFNAIVYDDDGAGAERDGWIEIVPGIAGKKEYSDAPFVRIGDK